MLQTAAPIFAELTPQNEPGPSSNEAGFEPAVMISVEGMSIGVGNNATRQLLPDLLEVVRHA